MAFDWNDRNKEHLREMWLKGLTASKIAARLGCSRNAVIGKSSRMGLPGRDNPIGRGRPRRDKERKPYDRNLHGRPSNNPSGRPPSIDRERVEALFDEGLTDREIGARLSCTPENIWKIRRSLGLERPKFSPASTRRAMAKAADRQFALPLIAGHALPQTVNREQVPPVALTVVNSGTSEQLGVALADLDRDGCRWPVSERARKHFFCNAKNDGLSAYCAEHHARGVVRAPDLGNLVNIENVRRVA